MALRDIYDANKTTAKDQETAAVGTRQRRTLWTVKARKDSNSVSVGLKDEWRVEEDKLP